MDDNPIYVAIDQIGLFEARRLADDLRGLIGGLKIGLTFWLRHGYTAARHVTAGYNWFLDLKFKDIPTQVDGAVRAVVEHTPRLLSVHEDGGTEMMQAAMQAAREEADTLLVRRPMILAVTTLTSLEVTPAVVLAQAYHAQSCGCDGVIASAREARLLRSELRSDMILLSPGIRPDGYSPGTHKRPSTPKEAIDAGVNYIVIGTPITAAPNPAEVVKDILLSIGGEHD